MQVCTSSQTTTPTSHHSVCPIWTDRVSQWQGNMEKFWGKCSFSTYVRNIQLNWVTFNRESRDLRWGCGCLGCSFTFVGSSRSHVCDSTAFLLKFLSIHFACTRHLIDGKVQENSYLPCAWSASGNMMSCLIICTCMTTWTYYSTAVVIFSTVRFIIEHQ